MSIRKFRINKDDILDLLKQVDITSVIVELPDTKETYKNLANLDWDFVDEEDMIEKIKSIEEEEGEQKLELNDFNKLATYVEAVFRAGKKSPALIFKSKTWRDEIEKQYFLVGHEPTTIEHTLISTLLSSFYGQFFTPNSIDNEDEVINDLNNRLENTWKEIQNHPSITSYLKILLK